METVYKSWSNIAKNMRRIASARNKQERISVPAPVEIFQRYAVDLSLAKENLRGTLLTVALARSSHNTLQFPDDIADRSLSRPFCVRLAAGKSATEGGEPAFLAQAAAIPFDNEI